ncbi:MAG TPA: response regulator transcription factor [Acetobacteraceae bacterium]|nr:response regulator transcription factor [Acetobacteraceae bacterium]
MTRLLLIEDDAATAGEIVADFTAKGFAIEHASDGACGLAAATAQHWDVLVVDRMLPSMDGLSIIRALRERGVGTPALILTALGAIDDRIHGLRSGGDDYLVKPFALGELGARLEALLRRPADSLSPRLRVGPLELDLIARTARRGTRTLDLLGREFQLLEFMMRREGQVVTRKMLLEGVWNYHFDLKSNLVDVHMGRLRRKLDEPGTASLITNIRGIGFILNAPA